MTENEHRPIDPTATPPTAADQDSGDETKLRAEFEAQKQKEVAKRLAGFENRFTKEINFINQELKQSGLTLDDENELKDRLSTLEQNRREILSFINGDLATEIGRREKELQRDPITNLPRLDAFSEMYEHSLHYLRPGEKIIVLAFDLDNFKDINETFGHVKADEILKKLADALQGTDTLKGAIRPMDFCSRVGGDEFLVILNNAKEEADVAQLIQRISQAISTVYWEDDQGNKHQGLTISAGCSSIYYGGRPYFNEIRGRADKLAGVSKRLGKNRLTAAKENTFSTYELRENTGGTLEYQLDKTGEIDKIQNSRESCQVEVKTNLVRIISELEKFFVEHRPSLEEHLETTYQKNKIDDLTLREIADLLYYVRANNEKKQ